MWRTKKLSQVCDIQSGLWKGKKEPFTEAFVLRNTNFTAGGKFDYSDVALLQVETKQLEKRTVLPNDIILEKSGGGEKTPVGRVCLHTSELDKPVSLSNFTARLRVINEEELTPSFLHRFLYFLYISGKTEPMQRNSTGIRNLQISQYKDIEVPLPPLAEQQRIVAKLDAVFDEIDKAIEVTESNLAHTKALLSSAIDRLISDTNKNKETTIAEETSMLSGFAFKSNEFTEARSDIALLRGDNIAPGSLNFLKAKRFPISEFSSYEKFSLSENDIVLGMDRPWISSGLRVAMLKKQHLPCLLVQRVMRLRTKKELCAEYLYILMQSDSFLKHILGNQTGLGVPHISGKTIGSYKFYLPNIDVQKSLVEKFSKTENGISQLKNLYNSKLKNLAFLKLSILTRELQSDAA